MKSPLVPLLTVVTATAAQSYAFDDLQESCFVNPGACCFEGNEFPWVQAEPRCKFNATTQSYPCAIKLGVSNLLGSLASAHVAKIFIEEFLGYPVDIVADSKDLASSGVDVETWELLENGTIDAILDFSGDIEEKEAFIIRKGTIKDGGWLGFSETIGWYIPKYLTFPSDSWEALTVPSNVQQLKNSKEQLSCCSTTNYAIPCIPDATLGGTPVSAGGLHNSNACDKNPNHLIPTYGGRLVAATRSSTKFEKDIIDQLGLNLTIEYAGTEYELVRELEMAEKSQSGLLLLLSDAHPIVDRYNLTRINLPRSVETCNLDYNGKLQACEYAAEAPYKAYGQKLLQEKPDVARLIELLRFSSSLEQQEIVSEVLFGGSSILRATCQSVRTNLPRWNHMLKDVEGAFNGTMIQERAPKVTLVNCGCIGNGSRYFVETWQSEDLGYAQIVSDPSPCSNPTFSSLDSRWTHLRFLSTNRVFISCDYAEATSPRSIRAMAVSGATAFVLLLTMGVVILFKEEPHMKASNVNTVLTFLLGAIVLNLYCMPQIGPLTTTKCFFRAAQINFGCAWFMGPLLAREISLFMIFFTGDGYVTCTKTFIQYQAVFCALGALILLLIWFVTAGFEVHPSDNARLGRFRETLCPSDDKMRTFGCFNIILMLLLSSYLSYKTRGISGSFTEGKNVIATVYLIGVLGIMLWIVLTMRGLSREYSVLISQVAISFITLTSAAVMVGPRLYLDISGVHFDREGLFKDKTVTAFGNKKCKCNTLQMGTSEIKVTSVKSDDAPAIKLSTCMPTGNQPRKTASLEARVRSKSASLRIV